MFLPLQTSQLLILGPTSHSCATACFNRARVSSSGLKLYSLTKELNRNQCAWDWWVWEESARPNWRWNLPTAAWIASLLVSFGCQRQETVSLIGNDSSRT